MLLLFVGTLYLGTTLLHRRHSSRRPQDKKRYRPGLSMLPFPPLPAPREHPPSAVFQPPGKRHPPPVPSPNARRLPPWTPQTRDPGGRKPAGRVGVNSFGVGEESSEERTLTKRQPTHMHAGAPAWEGQVESPLLFLPPRSNRHVSGGRSVGAGRCLLATQRNTRLAADGRNKQGRGKEKRKINERPATNKFFCLVALRKHAADDDRKKTARQNT